MNDDKNPDTPNTNTTGTEPKSGPRPTIITSAADLLAAYAAGERDFAHRVRLPYEAHLYRADLAGAHLRGADLRGAILAGAILWGANLAGANLAGADLRGADLWGADLTDANLWGADLTDANLTGASLYRADLTDANLTGAHLRGADLRGAILAGAQNIPPSSHDVLAELLRRAAGADVQRRAFTGLLLVSRDWCWQDYQRLREAGTWPAEIVAWVGETLGAHDSLAPYLRRYGWLPREQSAPTEAAEGGAE